MKKIILIFMSLLSLNLFGGLVHKDIDTRVQGKFGAGVSVHQNKNNSTSNLIKAEITPIWLGMSMKMNVYNTENYSMYLGSKIETKYMHVFAKKYELDYEDYLFGAFSIIGGMEESYNDDIKFYQQLEFGFSPDILLKKEINKSIINAYFGLTPAILLSAEAGISYKNILFSLGIEENISSELNYNYTYYSLTNISLGIGYEF